VKGTYKTPGRLCGNCEGAERRTRDGKCVNGCEDTPSLVYSQTFDCFPLASEPPAVFPDPTKELETEAYEAEEDAEEDREYGDYSHLGGPLVAKPYRPGVLKEWPIHTDFRPDELPASIVGRD
jgi:hypothetical protein